MGLITCQKPPQMQRLRHRMLVGRHGWPKRKVSECLQRIVEFIKAAVTLCPPAIPLGKSLRPGR
jgi:predicted ABC-type ATPase